MIKYNPKNWFGLIFHAFKGETFRMLLPVVFIIGILTGGVAYLELELLEGKFKPTINVHSLMGIVLGLFLVFRTNTAYDRWWEGRKKLGALVNDCRNMAIKINAMIPDLTNEEKEFFANKISDYVFALKEHLREGVKEEELSSLSKKYMGKGHIPNHISKDLYQKKNELLSSGRITQEQFLIFDKELKSLTDIIGACERIKNTPIPHSYSSYMKKFIFVYTLTLPIGMVPQFQYWSVPIVMLIFYFLVSLELIAEEIEDPFGRDYNDLPVDELAHKIKANVFELFELE